MPRSSRRTAEEPRPVYDFADGVRGKHHAEFRRLAQVVVLDDDVARVFPDSAAVNRALRLLIELAKKQVARKPAERPRR